MFPHTNVPMEGYLIMILVNTPLFQLEFTIFCALIRLLVKRIVGVLFA